MLVITLTINGVEVSAPAGATLLEACRENGVDLPTLCYLEGLTPVGACRLCLVQVEGARRLCPRVPRKPRMVWWSKPILKN